jgi:hypothetical protein
MTNDTRPLRRYRPDAKARATYRLKQSESIDRASLDRLRALAQYVAARSRSGIPVTLTVTGGTPCLRAFITRALERDGLTARQVARPEDEPSRPWPCRRATCQTCSTVPRPPATPRAALPRGLELIRQRKQRKKARDAQRWKRQKLGSP